MLKYWLIDIKEKSNKDLKWKSKICLPIEKDPEKIDKDGSITSQVWVFTSFWVTTQPLKSTNRKDFSDHYTLQSLEYNQV